MKKFVAIIFALLVAQNACASEIDFSSSGLTTWAWPIELVDNTSMNVTNSPGFQASISGPISGYGSLTKIGNGELILSGSNTYLGVTDIISGTLVISTVDAIPNGNSLTVGAGGIMIFDPSVTGYPSAFHESKPTPNTETVPEPSMVALFIIGLVVGGPFFRHS